VSSFLKPVFCFYWCASSKLEINRVYSSNKMHARTHTHTHTHTPPYVAGDIGKFFFSAGDNALIAYGHMPKSLESKGLTLKVRCGALFAQPPLPLHQLLFFQMVDKAPMQALNSSLVLVAGNSIEFISLIVWGCSVFPECVEEFAGYKCACRSGSKR